MTKSHRSAGVIVSLLLAGTALGGLTLFLVRRRGEQGEKPTELEDSWRDSWLTDDVLDLPTASSAPATNGAGEADTSRDDDLADIFDRPRSQ
ncbi:MAG TPA: hypothetical protein VHP33_27885 [Polyangiaceae bacterium]|nr:hypothetical protein [Polyangiaceae bacterium]